MKPINLTMTAFMSFASTVSIDFTKTYDDGIFLIAGKTGAGKTTIFDAITFALYGEASGDLRSPVDLRSKDADLDTECVVILDFVVNGNTYQITRYPLQELNNKSKTATRTKQHTAKLILPSGTEIGDIRTVNSTICELIGIEAAQFKKISMLAQGEFRQLLEAKSSTRAELFKKIFATTAYENFVKRIDEEYTTLNESYKSQNSNKTLLLDTIKTEFIPTLCEVPNPESLGINAIGVYIQPTLNQQKEEITKLATEVKTLEDDIAKINITEKRDLLSKFNLLEQLLANQQELADKQDEMEQLKKQLLLAEKANLVAQPKQAYDTVKESLQQNKDKLQHTQQQIAQNQQLWQQQIDKENELPKLRKTVEKNLQLTPALNQKLQAINYLQQLQETLVSEKNELAQSLSYLQMAEQCQEIAALLEQKKLIAQQIVTASEILTLVQQTLDKENIYKQQELDHKQLYEKFLCSQAGVLASNLIAGKPCLVCGSTTHPKLATTEPTVTRDAVDKLKLSTDAAFSDFTSSREQTAASIKNFVEPQDDYVIEKFEQNIPFFAQKQNDLQKEEQALEAKIQVIYNKIDSTKVSFAAIQKNSEQQFAQKREKLIKQKTEFQTKIELTQQQITQSKTEIGSDTKQLVNEQINTLQQQTASTLKQIDEITAAAQQSKIQKAQLTEAQNHLSDSVAQQERSVAALKQELLTALAQNDFKDWQSAKVAILPQPEQVKLRQTTADYDTNVLVTTTKLEQLQQQLKGKAIPNLQKLEQQLEEFNQTLSQKRTEQVALVSRNAQLQQHFTKLTEIMTKNQAVTEKLNQIIRLHKYARGENPKRIKFENYVLLAYFKDILLVANQYLATMTDGRYQLVHKEETEKHGATSGLMANVLDNDNGKQRPTATLSGGEAFKASLALALGLADVLRSYSGAVSVETLFIDEGFGTLDSDSLDTAMQTLLQLKENGRLVGIISHVDSIKERMNTVLEVTSDSKGSTAEFV